MYPSGSPGKRNGVVVAHPTAPRLFRAPEQWFHFGPDDVWTLFHSYAFDFSVWEIWGALLYGGRLAVVSYLISRSPAEFLIFLSRERITVLNQTPSAFYALIQADGQNPGVGRDLSVRYVIFGGETLAPGRLRDWYSRRGEDAPRLINMYGITETTVHVTYVALDREAAHTDGDRPTGCGIPDLALDLP